MIIYKLINLREKNTFNGTFPLRHTCSQRSLRIYLFGIMVGQPSFLSLSYIRNYSLSVAIHVVYLRDRSQLTGTVFLVRWLWWFLIYSISASLRASYWGTRGKIHNMALFCPLSRSSWRYLRSAWWNRGQA